MLLLAEVCSFLSFIGKVTHGKSFAESGTKWLSYVPADCTTSVHTSAKCKGCEHEIDIAYN